MKTYNTKILKIIILIIGITVVAVSSGKIFNYNLDGKTDFRKTQDKLPDELIFVKELSEDFAYYKHDTVSDRYNIYNSKGNLEFYILLTSPYCDNIRGFGGSVPFAIIVNNSDKIIGLHLLNHYETQSWIDKLNNNNFFDTWNGLDIQSAITKNIDAVSGATMTSEAVIESISRRLSEYKKVEEEKKKRILYKDLGVIIPLIVIIFALLSFLYPKKMAKLRIWLLLASVGVLGFWQADFLSMALLSNWLINGMSVMQNIVLFTILVLSILIPLIKNKPFYCQYVCPYGAAQELAGKIKIKNIVLNNKTVKILNPIKYILLFIITLIIVLKIDVSLENFEPFSAFQFRFASAVVLTIALVMLVLSFFNNKPWCKFFCPTGALFSMLRGKSGKTNLLAFGIGLIVFYSAITLSCNNTKPKNDNMEINNETLRIIHERKSVRNFTDKPVSDSDLELLVKAGMAAPSARNLQPWAFIIVNERDILDELGKSLKNARMLLNAQAAIIVCGDITKASMQPDSAYWVQDCCAATQNILLAAESIGLGAVWTAAYPYLDRLEVVRNTLKVPENLIPLNVIPIGYPTGEDKPKDKWDPEIVFWNNNY